VSEPAPAPKPVSKVRKCSICGEAIVDDVFRPFCSKRCSNVDLGRWLTGSYAIAGHGIEDDDDQPRTPVATAEDPRDKDE
jgi:uncharacterized protein